MPKAFLAVLPNVGIICCSSVDLSFPPLYYILKNVCFFI